MSDDRKNPFLESIKVDKNHEGTGKLRASNPPANHPNKKEHVSHRRGSHHSR